MSAASRGIRGGQPSTTQPRAGPWLSPKVVTRNRWPKLLWDMALHGCSARLRAKASRCHASPKRQVEARAAPSELAVRRGRRRSRSEEHTSELQSRQYLVCRLLLEKKKLTFTLNSC